jgi:acyl-CoA synthetase (AMP-forming)/AMP-acid ligase II
MEADAKVGAQARQPASYEEARARLTAPGSPFELGLESVAGREMPVFKQRLRSLRELLARSEAFGSAELAVWDTGLRWSFEEHVRLVASVAAGLRERHGIGPGSRVAILAENRPEWVLTAWATISLGGVVVAMNGWWQGDEIRYGLELGDPELLVVDRKRLARLEDERPALPLLVIEDDFEELAAWNRQAALPETPIDEDDLVAIMFTSGTTGRPKGAMISHRNLLAFLQMNFCQGAIAASLRPPAPDAPPPVSILSSPLFHVSGFQAGALMGPATGMKAVWTTGRFDPEKILRLTLEEGVTRWGGMTTQLWRLIEHPGFEPERYRGVRAVGGGGSTFSPELLRVLREKLPEASADLSVGYGLTECSGLCSLATGDQLLADPDSVGRPIPGNEVAIFDDEGQRLPDGVEGNICVRGPNVMLGYWRNPEATAEAFFEHGWLRTGDIGRLQGEQLFLAARKRDLIIRGGENVYPVEIENRIGAHPAVEEVAVVGVDHRTLGQEVKAIVVPRAGASPDPEQIRAFVAETLAYYKVPTHVEIRREALPRNATGKVLKGVLVGEGGGMVQEE